MLRYNRLTDQQERTSTFFQTTEAGRADPSRVDALRFVVAAVKGSLSNGHWRLAENKGSVTFEHKPEPTQPVTIFIDIDNKLANQYQLNLHDDPIVLAVDLADLSPFHRHCVRQELRSLFGDLYIDPENIRPQWGAIVKRHFNPVEHHFDIAFFRPGPCPEDLTPDKRTIAEVADLLRKAESGQQVEAQPCGVMDEDDEDVCSE